MKNSKIVGLALLSSAIMPLSNVHAEEMERSRWRKTALADGIGVRGLRVLRRAVALGRHQTAQRLSAKLALLMAGIEHATKVEHDDRTVLRGARDAWLLMVRGDGTRASFVDNAAYRQARARPRTRDQRVPSRDLEVQARQVFAKNIADVVRLRSNERLVALSTKRLVEDASDGITTIPQRVVANQVLFGREINGVPVVGNSSAVSVVLDNDGNMLEYEYNWPDYDQTESLEGVVDFRCGVERLAMLDPSRARHDATEVAHFECGYYSSEAAAELQPACAVVYRGTSEAGAGTYEEVFPMALMPRPISSWQESLAVSGATDTCRVTYGASASLIQQLLELHEAAKATK
jgi:hypothetical protein